MAFHREAQVKGSTRYDSRSEKPEQHETAHEHDWVRRTTGADRNTYVQRRSFFRCVQYSGVKNCNDKEPCNMIRASLWLLSLFLLCHWMHSSLIMNVLSTTSSQEMVLSRIRAWEKKRQRTYSTSSQIWSSRQQKSSDHSLALRKRTEVGLRKSLHRNKGT